jgi:hypothetical protein
MPVARAAACLLLLGRALARVPMAAPCCSSVGLVVPLAALSVCLVDVVAQLEVAVCR